jgi:phage terminase small subunit
VTQSARNPGKSPLALVLAAAKPPAGPRWRPPGHLKPATKRWFRAVVKMFAVEEHHVRVLVCACEAWDLMNQAREALAAAGSLTFDDRFGSPHARPEIAVARDARVGYLRAVRELCLDSAPDDPRPPRGAGRTDR